MHGDAAAAICPLIDRVLCSIHNHYLPEISISPYTGVIQNAEHNIMPERS
jgi:hypothetical protein